MINLLDTTHSVQLAEPTPYNKPKEILAQLDSLVVQSLAQSILQIEELLSNQLQRFAEQHNPAFRKTDLQFRVEVRNYRFTFLPENFYTYLLSEGVAVWPSEIEGKRSYIKGNHEYYFNSPGDFGVRARGSSLVQTSEQNP